MRAKILTAIIGIFAAALAVTIWYHSTSHKTSGPLVVARPMAPDHASSSLAADKPRANQANLAPDTSIDFRKQFLAASNYWKFSNDTLPAARSGDANAQFYLSHAMEWCAANFRAYFQRRGVTLSLEEGLRLAQLSHTPIEMAQRTYDRCHEFHEKDPSLLGNSADWLAAATASRQPAAEATTAEQLLKQGQMASFVKAGALPTIAPEDKIESPRNAQSLLRDGLEARDPNALWAIGNMQYLLNPSQDPTGNVGQLAWWLLACQAGYDCSSTADWVISACNLDARCSEAGAMDNPVQTFAGDHWQDVQQRADAIRAKLNARSWEELGLGT